MNSRSLRFLYLSAIALMPLSLSAQTLEESLLAEPIDEAGCRRPEGR